MKEKMNNFGHWFRACMSSDNLPDAVEASVVLGILDRLDVDLTKIFAVGLDNVSVPVDALKKLGSMESWQFLFVSDYVYINTEEQSDSGHRKPNYYTVIAHNSEKQIALIFEHNRYYVKIQAIGTDSMSAIEPILGDLRKFQIKGDEEENIVALTVVSPGVDSAYTYNVRFPLVQWESIADNYPSKRLANLVKDRTIWDRGKLLILNGKPGVGKTWFIKALVGAMHKDFDFYAVINPTTFIMRNHYYQITEPNAESSELSKNGHPKRRIFILEDAADLVLLESRQNIDLCSKFLNLTDGFMSTVFRDSFIVTFNEEIDAVDEAYLRPGRCIDYITIPEFTREQAADWLKKKNGKFDSGILAGNRMFSIAELYKILYPGIDPLRSAANSGR